MLHYFLYGLLLGWGAAVPLGPLNLEMIRRNLQFGTVIGLALGMGASSADLTYLLLLLMGALAILQHAIILKIVAGMGAIILVWFGVSALRLSTQQTRRNSPHKMSAAHKPEKIGKHFAQGYFITMLNPFTILFWSSVSVQVAQLSNGASHSILYLIIAGVIVATVSWVIALNTVLHVTRHRLSATVMHYLNMAGGIILLGFAAYGILRIF